MKYFVAIYSKSGQLLVQTWNIGEHSRDMEISVAKGRPDVGEIKWWSEDDPSNVHRVDTGEKFQK